MNELIILFGGKRERKSLDKKICTHRTHPFVKISGRKQKKEVRGKNSTRHSNEQKKRARFHSATTADADCWTDWWTCFTFIHAAHSNSSPLTTPNECMELRIFFCTVVCNAPKLSCVVVVVWVVLYFVVTNFYLLLALMLY